VGQTIVVCGLPLPRQIPHRTRHFWPCVLWLFGGNWVRSVKACRGADRGAHSVGGPVCLPSLVRASGRRQGRKTDVGQVGRKATCGPGPEGAPNRPARRLTGAPFGPRAGYHPAPRGICEGFHEFWWPAGPWRQTRRSAPPAFRTGVLCRSSFGMGSFRFACDSDLALCFVALRGKLGSFRQEGAAPNWVRLVFLR
jgi:hypothetical protein